jgi:hypothetical protein
MSKSTGRTTRNRRSKRKGVAVTAFEIRKVAVCGNCASVNDPWCERCRGCNSARDLITQFRCGCSDVLLPTAECPRCRAIKETEARAAEAKRAAALVLEAKRAEATKAEEARAKPEPIVVVPKKELPANDRLAAAIAIVIAEFAFCWAIRSGYDYLVQYWNYVHSLQGNSISDVGYNLLCLGLGFVLSAIGVVAALILVGIGFHVLTLIKNVFKGNTSGEQVIDTILTDLKVVVAIFIRK